jgi:hypothetical protein
MEPRIEEEAGWIVTNPVHPTDLQRSGGRLSFAPP